MSKRSIFALAIVGALGLALALLGGYRLGARERAVDDVGADLIDHSEHLALLVSRARAEAGRAEDASRRAVAEWDEYRLAVERRDAERRAELERIERVVDEHVAGLGRLRDGLDGDYELAVRCLELSELLVGGLARLRATDNSIP